MVKCFSCGKKCYPETDKCHGCGKIVCVKCAMKYGHEFRGEHGHRPTKRATDGGNAGVEYVKTKLGEGLMEYIRETRRN